MDLSSLLHVLHTDMYLPPPIIHAIAFCPPLGKKLKETLIYVCPYIYVVHGGTINDFLQKAYNIFLKRHATLSRMCLSQCQASAAMLG